jgi:hypothetical protein
MPCAMCNRLMKLMAWLDRHPEIRERLTVYEMIRNFNRDIREANKYNRN